MVYHVESDFQVDLRELETSRRKQILSFLIGHSEPPGSDGIRHAGWRSLEHVVVVRFKLLAMPGLQNVAGEIQSQTVRVITAASGHHVDDAARGAAADSKPLDGFTILNEREGNCRTGRPAEQIGQIHAVDDEDIISPGALAPSLVSAALGLM